MTTHFPQADVSIALLRGAELPYDEAAFMAGLQAALGQDHPAVEVLIVDNRGPTARPDFLPAAPEAAQIVHLPTPTGPRCATRPCTPRGASSCCWSTTTRCP